MIGGSEFEVAAASSGDDESEFEDEAREPPTPPPTAAAMTISRMARAMKKVLRLSPNIFAFLAGSSGGKSRSTAAIAPGGKSPYASTPSVVGSR